MEATMVRKPGLLKQQSDDRRQSNTPNAPDSLKKAQAKEVAKASDFARMVFKLQRSKLK